MPLRFKLGQNTLKRTHVNFSVTLHVTRDQKYRNRHGKVRVRAKGQRRDKKKSL